MFDPTRGRTGPATVPNLLRMTDVRDLPRWDTASLFPGLASRAYADASERLGADVERLAALFDRHGVGGGEPADATAGDIAALDDVLGATNAVLEQLRLLEAFVHALVTTDADDTAAAAEQARLDGLGATLEVLAARRDAWIARLGAGALAGASPTASEHGYLLQRSGEAAEHLLSDGEEALAAELRLTGGLAWARLWGELTSRLTGTLEGETVPATVLRGRAEDPERAVREAAWRAEQEAWESISTPAAACLNGIKGEAVTMNQRRGWPDALAPALWANGIDRAVLDAMQAAVVASFPDFRRFLRAKAALLGAPGALAWWDLVAPVPGEAAISWAQASTAVEEAFSSYSPQLRSLARRAFDERWVDAGPRAGKRGGAFCMPVRGAESRVLMNFSGSWDSASTLAHELGHAYHNTNLASRPALARTTPMALAETASIFCETLMTAAALDAADETARLALLNVDLQGACQVVVDIHSRFLFESAVFERRRSGLVAVPELCELMRSAQAETYGDGVDPATYHPWMWVLKPHYYFPEAHFYNWPYTFGLLFGLGLFARYQEDADAFRADYDDLLASTGSAPAAELAGRFDIDITDEGFWTSSLDVVRARIEEFVALAGAGPC